MSLTENESWTYFVTYNIPEGSGMIEIRTTHRISSYDHITMVASTVQAKNNFPKLPIITNFILLSKPKWYKRWRKV